MPKGLQREGPFSSRVTGIRRIREFPKSWLTTGRIIPLSNGAFPRDEQGGELREKKRKDGPLEGCGEKWDMEVEPRTVVVPTFDYVPLKTPPAPR